jgi:HTH-type transcriptional regulator/antitoxin HigA
LEQKRAEKTKSNNVQETQERSKELMLNVTKITDVWAKNSAVLNHISRPKTEADYLELIDLIEHITDTVDDLENNPYIALLDIALTYADEWEEAHVMLEDSSTPRDTLSFLMEQHNLTQKDLERLGIASQPVISKILKGERDISKGVAQKLAAYFNVKPNAFLF